jgi:hypothetical protein
MTRRMQGSVIAGRMIGCAFPEPRLLIVPAGVIVTFGFTLMAENEPPPVPP